MIPAQHAILTASPLRRQRVQLGGAFVLAVLLPLLVRLWIGSVVEIDDLSTTVVANILAITLGHYIFRSLTAHPGIAVGGYVLPAFSIAYGVILACLLGTRLDYSRFLLLLGFGISLSWYLGTFLLAERRRLLTIGVVPFGGTDQLSVLGRVHWHVLSAPNLADMHDIDAVVADFRADLPREWEQFLADCALRGTLVYHHKQLGEYLTGRVEIDHISENTFGSLVPVLVYVKLKQIFDVSSAFVALIALLPMFAIVAVLIKVDSPGPVLFKQRRVGFRGEVFRVCKFRTMRHTPDAVASSGVRHAITQSDDPRITRLGRFLRRTRIDELPQVLNILAGQMSWIGPRPEAEVLSRWYEAELPFYRYRHVVKPGISGWAQVNQGHVAEIDDIMGKLHYDFYYIKYFSPWLDAVIIFKTIGTVLTGFGSK